MASFVSINGGGATRSSTSFLGAIVVWCCFWLLFVEVVASGTTIRTPTSGSLQRLDVLPRDSHDHVHVVHLHSDPNSMSKRKVPNGPDPIHNRRAGKSGQPPGRA